MGAGAPLLLGDNGHRPGHPNPLADRLRRTGGSLNEYGFAYVERNTFGDDLRIRLGGAIEIGHGAFESTGYGLFPELAWQAIDNFEVVLGAFVLDGRDASNGVLGMWRRADQVFLKTTVHF